MVVYHSAILLSEKERKIINLFETIWELSPDTKEPAKETADEAVTKQMKTVLQEHDETCDEFCQLDLKIII